MKLSTIATLLLGGLLAVSGFAWMFGGPAEPKTLLQATVQINSLVIAMVGIVLVCMALLIHEHRS